MSQATFRRVGSIVASIGLLLLSLPRAAGALTPEAASGVARALPAALPTTASWNPAWNDAISTAVDRHASDEATDPDGYFPFHHYVSASPLPAACLSDLADPGLAVDGAAPLALAAAAADLQNAFAAGDAADFVDAAARLAIAATDLADPFLTTSCTEEETPGARAAFCDPIAPEDLSGLVAPTRAWSADPVAAGCAIAAESASLRGAVEEAVRASDWRRVGELRRDRLAAALSLAGALARENWLAAGSPNLEGVSPSPNRLRVTPNPARDRVSIGFSLVQAVPARLELFDVSGRRVFQRELPAMGAGPQRVDLEGASLWRLPAGVYLARLTAAGQQANGRLTLLSH